MNEQERLQELYDYHVLDTPPEKALDELVQLACLIFKSPISLITLIDEDREWYKAVKGLDAKEISRANSFCQHTIGNPKQVLTVTNATEDPRFRDNPLVTGEPNIRFYAGAPLETPKGNVLGTICVIDTKPRKPSKEQKEALKILAKKAMEHLNARKQFSAQNPEISSYTQEILKLTDEIPGVIYQFRMSKEGTMSFDFFSSGINKIFPGVDPLKIKEDPLSLSRMIPPEEITALLKGIQTSFENLTDWEAIFRVQRPNGEYNWYRGKARPRKEPDGSVIWCGFLHNVTRYKEYQQKMERLAFDISHVLRKPVVNLLGLTAIAQEKGLKKKELVKYMEQIKRVSEELEEYTRRLNEIYQHKPEASSN